MDRTPVKSSMMKSVGYDPATKILHVEFPTGQVYEYSGVTPEQHSAFMAAESMGKHFGKHIAGGKFPFKKIDSQPRVPLQPSSPAASRG